MPNIQTVIPNYLWTVDTHTNNNDELYRVCLQAEAMLKHQFPKVDGGALYGSFTTSLFKKYNIFTFASPDLLKLYYCIVEHIKPYLDKNKGYVMQAWVNVFRTGEFIDWHAHWPAESRVMHGYYCVNANDSTTSYRFDSDRDIVYDVYNKNGLLVFGDSAGDEHRSSPWIKAVPRVTIAFDIVPVDNLSLDTDINHYIPFKA